MATLEQHIAYLKTHGMARTNRFMVIIPLPSGLTLPARKTSGVSGSELDQILTTIDKESRSDGISSNVHGTRSLELKVSQTNFPMKTINLSETKYNGDIHKMGSTIMYGAQQFVFEVSEDMYEKNIIDAWMSLIVNPNTFENAYYKDYVTDIVVHQLDMKDRPTHTIVLQDAFPMTCNELTLSNKEMNNTHELMTMFSFRRWYSASSDSANTVINNSIVSLLTDSEVLQPFFEEHQIDPRLLGGIEIIDILKGIDLEHEAREVVKQLENVVYSITKDTINYGVDILNDIGKSVKDNLNIPDFDKQTITRGINDTVRSYIPWL